MKPPIRYLLDTNVIFEVRKKKADREVMNFFQRTSSSALYLSVLSLGEMRKGVKTIGVSNTETAMRLGAWLDGLEFSFADRLIPIDGPVARIWGELSADRSRPVIDTLLAATAIHHDLTMVTRKVVDYRQIPRLAVLNPWKS